MKPFLILQLRPETAASDDEYQAILAKAGLTPAETHRIRLDQQVIPADLMLDDYSGVIVGGGPGCVSDPEDKKTPVEKQIEAAIAFCTRPDYVYSHHWQVGDVLIWDERATLHRGQPWPYDQPRSLSSICCSVTDADGLASVRIV